MWVEISEQVGAFSIEDEVVLVVEVADFSIPSGITADILTEKGSMIVATAAGVVSETGAPSADGLVWVSDATEILGGRWAAQSGGGGDIELTNKSGSNQVAGTVVIHDADNNSSFKTTTTLRDRRVIGVLSEDIISNASGKVAVAGKIVTVKVQGNVTRGQWLIASATEGRAQQDGYTRTPGVIGMALTSYAGGGAGTVSALIAVDLYLGASKGKGYCMGGFTTTYVTTTQVLSFVNETTAVIAGAALSVARWASGGASGSAGGYALGGVAAANSAVVDKVAFATDITAAVASLPAAQAYGSNSISGPLVGYMMGGLVAAFSVITYKVTYSTDISAAQVSANLTVARGAAAGFQSTTIGYALGGVTTGTTASAVADKMPFSTETTAAVVGANMSVARYGAVGVQSGTDGYADGGSVSGGAVSAVADKMPFATEVTAAKVSANLSVARGYPGGLSANFAGYLMGGLTTVPVVTADKLTYSTDVTAALSGANLPTAIQYPGSVSTTNY